MPRPTSILKENLLKRSSTVIILMHLLYFEFFFGKSLSLRFSSSRTLSLLASKEVIPLNFCLHFLKVLLETEYLRHTSAMEFPGSSASERICIIFSTGYYVCFIGYSPFLKLFLKLYPYFCYSKKRGAGQRLRRKELIQFAA